MKSSKKIKLDIKHLEGLADIQPEIKQVRLVEMLGEQGFQYDTKQFFEPITKRVTDASQKVIEKAISTTNANEELDELYFHVKALQRMSKNGVVH